MKQRNLPEAAAIFTNARDVDRAEIAKKLIRNGVMKRIAVLILSWMISLGVSADWVQFDSVQKELKSDSFNVYADLSTKKSFDSGKLVKISVLVDYLDQKVSQSNQRYLSNSMAYLIDCSSRMDRPMGYRRYSEHMGQGTVVDERSSDIRDSSDVNILAKYLQESTKPTSPKLIEIACKESASQPSTQTQVSVAPQKPASDVGVDYSKSPLKCRSFKFEHVCYIWIRNTKLAKNVEENYGLDIVNKFSRQVNSELKSTYGKDETSVEIKCRNQDPRQSNYPDSGTITKVYGKTENREFIIVKAEKYPYGVCNSESMGAQFDIAWHLIPVKQYEGFVKSLNAEKINIEKNARDEEERMKDPVYRAKKEKLQAVDRCISSCRNPDVLSACVIQYRNTNLCQSVAADCVKQCTGN